MRWAGVLRDRMRSGMRRFRTAFFWCAALFCALLWGTFCEPTPEGRAMTGAFFCAACFAAAAQCFRESGKAGAGLQWMPLLSFPAAGLWYLYFFSLGAQGRLMEAAAGSAGAAGALAVCFLTARHGEAVFSRIFAAAWKALGLSLLLTASLFVCLFAADELLFDIRGEWYSAAAEFAFCLVGLPFFFSWLPEERAGPPHLLSALFRRVLFPVYLILLAILYGYIGKILLSGVMPVGQMNWFASLAVLGYALFYFLLPDETWRGMRLFQRFGGPLLLPVVAAQLVGVWIRVDAYGLTEARYASLLCTVFGLVVMGFGFFRRGRGMLFLLAAAVLAAASMGPFAVWEVPLRDQVYRAQTVMARYGMMREGEIVRGEALPKEERDRLLSAYWYIRRDAADSGTYSFAKQIAASPVIRELAEEAAREKEEVRSLAEEGPVSVAGYDRFYVFRSTDDGVIRAAGLSYDAGPQLEALFRTRTAGPQTEPMVWEPDGRHRVVFRRCTQFIKPGKPVSYWAEGLILERD